MKQLSITKQQITTFQKKIFTFYKNKKRNLPWRNTTDPYNILLSEIMLQQTQVSRVITFYNQWIHRWPTIESLAQATQPEILNAWMGLGYNNRAIHLHQTAHIITKKYKGDILNALQHYKELPGIGIYTAKAIHIFATNKDLVTVDTNIRRILIHEFNLPQDTPLKKLHDLAEHCLPKGKSRDWHNALMDYGALTLTAKKTHIKPLTTQKRFQGSNRQIRAQILRLLLQHQKTKTELQTTLNTEPTRLQSILKKMTNEHLITYHNKKYQIPE